MKKSIVNIGICIILTTVLITGCVNENIEKKATPSYGDTKTLNEVYIGGRYNSTLKYEKIYLGDTWENYTKIKYIKDGVEYEVAFLDHCINSFNWIKNHTEMNSTVLCWWDYGGMIEGYSQRKAVAVYPSLAVFDTMALYHGFDEKGRRQYIQEHDWSNNETIEEIATVLTTDSLLNQTVQNILEKYNVRYLFTRSYDKILTQIFLSAAGRDLSKYYIGTPDEDGKYYGNNQTKKTHETLIYKMWETPNDIIGLNLIYTNNYSTNVNPNYNKVQIFKVEDSLTNASYSEVINHLDTPTKTINYMKHYFEHVYHDGCVSYEPDEFFEIKKGDCKDYATFFSYVLDYHGIDANIVTFTFYDKNDTREGHVVTLFNDTNGVMKYQSNENILYPVESISDLLEKEKTRLNATRIGGHLILDPGATYCCSPG